ncbi:MAG: hypothetical protein ABIQ18_49375 [Umezawaea sp.]
MNDHQDPAEAFLRAELPRVAAEHEPDRAAILTRIAANRASRRPTWGPMRLAGAAFAVATVLGLGGIAGWSLVAHDVAGTSAAAPPPTTAPATADSASPSPSAAPTSRPAADVPPQDSAPASTPSTSTAPPSVVRGHPGDTQVEKGSLRSDGSITAAGTGASASTVTLVARADLTELDLTIRVALTPGLTQQGSGNDVPVNGVTATVERLPDALLYRFVLREGVTLPAGTYHFTARYGHDGAGRDAAGDTYEAFTADADRKRPHVYGNFSAK